MELLVSSSLMPSYLHFSNSFSSSSTLFLNLKCPSSTHPLSSRKRNTPFLVPPTSSFIIAHQDKHSHQCGLHQSSKAAPLLIKAYQYRDVFWRFLRPHIIHGTILAYASLLARVVIENPDTIRWSLLLKAFSGGVALICANGNIVGINQIYDVGIDKVKKPHFPIAAGDLSERSTWFLVLLLAAAGLLIVGLTCGPFVTSLLFL